MTACPSCGADLSDARKLVKRSAKELVEALALDSSLLRFCLSLSMTAIHAEFELDAFKDRMRANGYKTNAGPVKDAHAAFRTHLRNAVKFGAKNVKQPAPTRAFQNAKKREE